MSLRTSFALMTGLALAAVPTIAAAERAPIVQVERNEAPAQAKDEATSYAQREAQDKKAADYRGGNTVVIALSGSAFVVLLLLLLLL
jgi:hypothetical protein